MASLDVIIPCYNYGHFLRACIDSLRAQYVDDLRILIIDDASTDNSAETAQKLAREDPQISVVVHSRIKATSPPTMKELIGSNPTTCSCFPRMTWSLRPQWTARSQ